MTSTRRAFAALGLAAAMSASQAFAGANDYDFKAVSGELKAGAGKTVAIKIVNKKTNKHVEGVVFVKTQLDMSPENMADVKGKVSPDKSADPAVYKFYADLKMSGVWALKLTAKAPGESQPLQGVIIFRVND
jgi:ABC-type uncharacterized transport system ATPase subunit